MRANPEIKVGDKLAFHGGYAGWSVHEVTKITPSGRIKCGHYELNPDLSIRGKTSRWNGPFCAHIITPEIREEWQRQKAVLVIKTTKLTDLPTETLLAIEKLIKEVKP